MQFATDIQNYTCTCCPIGCNLEVALDAQGELIEVTGYSCERGKTYAIEESTHPVRMLTSLVYVKGCLEPLSVKTERSIPKAKMKDVSSAIQQLDLEAPIAIGDVVLEDVCGTGVSIIATKSLSC